MGEKLALSDNSKLIPSKFVPSLWQVGSGSATDPLSLSDIILLSGFGLDNHFHALRVDRGVLVATHLARAGTTPRVAMEIMRHSDMRLTAKTCTDAGLLPVADAVPKLPFLSMPKDATTQIGTQDLFREGHDLSDTGTTVAGIPLLGLSGNEQLGREKESPVQIGQNLEMVRGTGFEPVTFRV